MTPVSLDPLRPLPYVMWNLFLAVIPVALAFAAARIIHADTTANRPVRRGLVALILLVWAVFLPNTCYLVTEWRHYMEAIAAGSLHRPAVLLGNDLGYAMSHRALVTLLVSTAFYLAYSGSGLIAFFLAVWPLDRLIRQKSIRRSAAFKLSVFALSSLGVYLGLIHRFNTLDLVKPKRFAEIVRTVSASVFHPFVLGLMLIFVLVLWILYVEFEIWMDGWAARNARTLGD
jgi:uncharacterized membrane protein